MCVCVGGGGGGGGDEMKELKTEDKLTQTTCVKDRVIIHLMMFKSTNMTAFSHIINS